MTTSFFTECDILITGGIGFIGSTIALRLVQQGARVTIIDSQIPEFGGNPFNISGLEKKIQLNLSDIRDSQKMQDLVQGKDYLFNLAAQTSHMDSLQDPLTDLDINCRGQVTVLEACRQANPDITIVFTSTRQIYGKPRYLPVDEQHLVQPVDPNGITKAAGEWYHLFYDHVHGIKTSILRLTNTYGPRMRIRDARQNFLGWWVHLVLQGHPIDVWGGSQLRDFTYIDDVVDALMLAASNKSAYGQIFNVGGEEPVSLKSLAELLIQVNGEGRYFLREYPQDRKRIDIGDYYTDYSKITKCLNWKPTVPLEEGLTRTLDYFRQYKDHYL
jgi:UDP-glucose 4-epimerase